MAINIQNLLAPLTPAVPLDFGSGGGSMERERLRLAREQFENEKKQQEYKRQQDELARQAAAAKLALEGRIAQDKAEAKMAAEALKQKQAGELKFAEAGGAMNAEGMAAMAPYLRSLGSGVDYLGAANGLPSYRVYDPAEEAKRQAQPEQLGYPEAQEQGILGDGVSRGDQPFAHSTEDAYAQALAASQYARENGKALRDPDEEDYLGAVPRDVIDLGAIHAQTVARLKPGLKAATEAYTDPTLRAQAQKSAEVAMQSGLPADKAIELYEKNQDTHDTTYRTKLTADAQTAKFRETRDQLTVKDISGLQKDGEAAADERAVRDDVPGGVKALRTIDEIRDILEDEGPGSKENDTMIAGALMSIQDVKGIPSDKDMAMAFGMGKASAITQVISRVQELAEGGFSDAQRDAIKKFIARVEESQRQKIGNYLDSQDQIGYYNEHKAEGYKGYVKRAVPGFLYNEWLDKRKSKDDGKGQGSAPTGSTSRNDPEFDKALDEGARSAGYDPDKIRAVIAHESSGGDPTATSSAGAKGAFQLMPDRAKEAGTSSEELGKMTAAQQVPSGIKYLQTTQLKGDAPLRDYALAFAAPAYIGKSDDTVIEEYKKGTKRGDAVRAQNPGWIPKDGGDITVGSIADYYQARGSGRGAERKADASNPYQERTQELIKKLRGG